MRSHFQKHNFPFVLLIVSLAASFVFFVFQGAREHKKPHVKVRKTREPATLKSQDQRLQKFSLTGFDGKGKVFWKLEGDTANIDPTQKIFLEKNVTLRLKENTTVRTEWVRWSPDNQTLKTDALVYVDHESVKVRGTGAVGRPSENFIQLNRYIQMWINEKTQLDCVGPMKIYYNQNKMIFYRNVRVTDVKGSVTARRMDVFFDPDQKKVKQIVAIGQVKIERGGDTTRSDRAIYTVADNSVRLEGNPEITLHKNSMGLVHGAAGNAGT